MLWGWPPPLGEVEVGDDVIVIRLRLEVAVVAGSLRSSLSSLGKVGSRDDCRPRHLGKGWN